jgi:hypothetical protein
MIGGTLKEITILWHWTTVKWAIWFDAKKSGLWISFPGPTVVGPSGHSKLMAAGDLSLLQYIVSCMYCTCPIPLILMHQTYRISARREFS